jgi:hypothetical protein
MARQMEAIANTVIARQLVDEAIQSLVDLFITGLLRFARSDSRTGLLRRLEPPRNDCKLDNFFTILTLLYIQKATISRRLNFNRPLKRRYLRYGRIIFF